MKIEDFLEEVRRVTEPTTRELMLKAALLTAIENFTFQMKFAHEKDLQRIAEINQAVALRCPHTTTHIDPDSFIYDHHVCDQCGTIVKSE